MPLVVLAGLPSSGKTTRAEQVADLFRNDGKQVHVVTDDLSPWGSKNVLYASSCEEKIARGTLKSSVERLLTKDCVVILDSLNYIKGFRYELYCVSKHLDSTLIVIHCDTPIDTARSWNAKRSDDERYSRDIFDAVAMRFEAPNSMNRWDSPLFVVYPEDDLPKNDIRDALLLRKPPPPNQSTQSQPLSSADFLHELDRHTQLIVNQILQLQRQGLSGESVVVLGTTEKLSLHRQVSLAELRRLRQQFIKYSKMHPVDNLDAIPTLFTQYLNNTI